MRNPFYLVWADCITSIQSNKDKEYRNNWKSNSLFLMTMLMAVNLFTIALLLATLNVKIPNLEINIFPGNMLNTTLEGFITFGLPCLLINYFFIFYKDRYKKIIQEYKPQKRGRYTLIYTFTSIGLSLGYVLLLYFKIL